MGGYAVGIHGYPRATVDLDVWVRPSPDNAARVLNVGTPKRTRLRASTKRSTVNVPVPVISLADLKTNKRAAGRHKDLADLEQLP